MFYPPQNHCRTQGLTLTELLICMAILGVIATFSIPKILQAQQNQAFNAKAKEVAGTISQAYQLYRLAGGSVTTMRASDLNVYLNYTSVDNSASVDDVAGGGAFVCGTLGLPCYRLHNGGVLHHYNDGFCNGSPTAVAYDFDPDGAYSGATTGPGKSVRFFIYSDGKMTTEGTLQSNTVWNFGGGTTCNYTRSAIPASDPAWWSW